MRAAIIIILGVLAATLFAIDGHLVSDGHRQTAYYYLCAGQIVSVVDVFLIIIFAIPNRKPALNDNSPDDSALPINPKLRQALARLQALCDHLPKTDLSENYINDYHAILDSTQVEIHQDLSPFRIPQSELVRHISNISWEGGYRGNQISYGQELFCPPHVFRIALSGVLNFIKTCPPTQATPQIPPPESPKELNTKTTSTEPQSQPKPSIEREAKPEPPQIQKPKIERPKQLPSVAHKPDNIDVKILKYIYEANYADPVKDLPDELTLSPLEIETRLGSLIKHDYVNYDSNAHLFHNSPYCISEKGKAYLLTTVVNLPPFPTGRDLLDEAKINILKLLAHPDCQPYESWIALALQMHLVKVQFHLAELRKQGYVVAYVFNSMTGEADNELTQKARAYLIENDLID
jgi:hypothetical protein